MLTIVVNNTTEFRGNNVIVKTDKLNQTIMVLDEIYNFKLVVLKCTYIPT